MNAKEFLDKEKNTYGNLYSELIFVLDDIEYLREDSTLKAVSYTHLKLPKTNSV